MITGPCPSTSRLPAPLAFKTEESPRHRHPMTDREWGETVNRLRAQIGLLDLAPLTRSLQEMAVAYTWLNQRMEGYCNATCPSCSDPCCQAAEVFYNRTDLLVLLASGTSPPPGQTRTRPLDPCRYLTPTGCSLTRRSRPYVCVWYLCEAQMELFQEERGVTQRRFIAVMETIRRHRLWIESLYESHFPD